MPYARRPRFDWVDPNVASLTVEAEIPQKPWGYRTPTIGSVVWSGSGLPVSYRVRSDADLDLVLRFLEHEWPDVLEFLRFAQQGNAFTFFPDANELTSFTCYLVSPAPAQGGASIRPQRQSGEFVPLFVLPITIRRAALDAKWNLNFSMGAAVGGDVVVEEPPGTTEPGTTPPGPTPGGPGGGGGAGGGTGGTGGTAPVTTSWKWFFGPIRATANEPAGAHFDEYRERFIGTPIYERAIPQATAIWDIYQSDPVQWNDAIYEMAHYGNLIWRAQYEIRTTGVTGPGNPHWTEGEEIAREYFVKYIHLNGFPWWRWHSYTFFQDCCLLALTMDTGPDSLGDWGKRAMSALAEGSSYATGDDGTYQYSAGFPEVYDNNTSEMRITGLSLEGATACHMLGRPYTGNPRYGSWAGLGRKIINDILIGQRTAANGFANTDGGFPYAGTDNGPDNPGWASVSKETRARQPNMECQGIIAMWRFSRYVDTSYIPAVNTAIVAWANGLIALYDPIKKAIPYVTNTSAGAPDLNAYYFTPLTIAIGLGAAAGVTTLRNNLLTGINNGFGGGDGQNSGAWLGDDPIMWPGSAINDMKHVNQYMSAGCNALNVFALAAGDAWP